MEKKLYRVKVVLYVMAENESAARVAATRANFDIFECTARKAVSVDLNWNEAVPYNSDDSRTCAEVLLDQSPSQAAEFPLYVKTGLKAFDAGRAYLRVGP